VRFASSGGDNNDGNDVVLQTAMITTLVTMKLTAQPLRVINI
jgi:hypothetical protein